MLLFTIHLKNIYPCTTEILCVKLYVQRGKKGTGDGGRGISYTIEGEIRFYSDTKNICIPQLKFI